MEEEQVFKGAILYTLQNKTFLVDMGFEGERRKIAAAIDYCHLQIMYLAKYGYDVGKLLNLACTRGLEAFLRKENSFERLQQVSTTLEDIAMMFETVQPMIAQQERIKMIRDFNQQFKREYLQEG